MPVITNAFLAIYEAEKKMAKMNFNPLSEELDILLKILMFIVLFGMAAIAGHTLWRIMEGLGKDETPAKKKALGMKSLMPLWSGAKKVAPADSLTIFTLENELKN